MFKFKCLLADLRANKVGVGKTMDNEIVGDGTLMDGVIKNGVCSSESLNGSCDVWSCKDSDSSSADHLVIMVHGIFGRLDSMIYWNFFL